MAPRRLIIVMLVLLAFSTALAILVPEPRTPDGDTDSDRTTTERTRRSPSDEPAGSGSDQVRRSEERSARKDAPGNTGRTVERTVRAQGPVERISIAKGDRLVVEVRSPRPIVVSIAGAGLVDAAGPYDPARFDLLARNSGERLIVKDLDSGRRLARIDVG